MRGWCSILQDSRAAHLFVAVLVVLSGTLHAQFGQQAAPSTSTGQGASTPSSSSGSAAGQFPMPLSASQDPYTGSVITEKATDQVVWATDFGDEIIPNRAGDAHFRGNIVQAMIAYAEGRLGPPAVDLKEVDPVDREHISKNLHVNRKSAETEKVDPR